jgi:hypothetical protein
MLKEEQEEDIEAIIARFKAIVKVLERLNALG